MLVKKKSIRIFSQRWHVITVYFLGLKIFLALTINYISTGYFVTRCIDTEFFNKIRCRNIMYLGRRASRSAASSCYDAAWTTQAPAGPFACPGYAPRCPSSARSLMNSAKENRSFNYCRTKLRLDSIILWLILLCNGLSEGAASLKK